MEETQKANENSSKTMNDGGPNSGGTGQTEDGPNSFSPAMGGTGTGPQHGGGIAQPAPTGVGTGKVPPVGAARIGEADEDALSRTSTSSSTAAGSAEDDQERALSDDDDADDTREVADGTDLSGGQ